MADLRNAAIVAIVFVLAGAGCLGTTVPPSVDLAPLEAVVVDAAGKPIPYAQATVLNGKDVLFVASTNRTGILSLQLPAAATSVRIGAPGFLSKDLTSPLPTGPITLEAGTGLVEGLLRFLPPVELVCPTDPANAGLDTANRRECGGFGEPVVEVASDGAIWASATCCLFRAPPIWISRDQGKTFEVLHRQDTGLIRETIGVEGDFAIDDAGNVYFFDMFGYLEGSWFTSFTKDGAHRGSYPLQFVGTVDRPWVRAAKEDQVFILYNTGGSTIFASSTDGGENWDDASRQTFGCPLGTFGQGPSRERLFVVACTPDRGATPTLWITEDAGKSWSEGEEIPIPNGTYEKETERAMPFLFTAAADESGTIYVVYPHRTEPKAKTVDLFVSRRATDGTWDGPFQVSPGGINTRPWIVGGAPGQFAIAWYHTDANEKEVTKADWYLMVAASVDALSPVPHVQWVYADPKPVHHGEQGRSLGDFLEADLTPDGKLGIVYARSSPFEGVGSQAVEANSASNFYIQTDGGLPMILNPFPNGPKKA